MYTVVVMATGAVAQEEIEKSARCQIIKAPPRDA